MKAVHCIEDSLREDSVHPEGLSYLENLGRIQIRPVKLSWILRDWMSLMIWRVSYL